MEEAATIALTVKQDYYAGKLPPEEIRKKSRRTREIFLVVTESGTPLHKQAKAAFIRKKDADRRVEDETTADGYVTAYVELIILYN